LGFWEGNRLAAHSQPPGDAWDFYQFMDLDEGPGGADPAARRREQNVSILMILEFWEILHSGKML